MKTSPQPGPRSEAMDTDESELLMEEAQRRRGGGAVRRQHSTQQAAASFLSSYFSRRFLINFYQTLHQMK